MCILLFLSSSNRINQEHFLPLCIYYTIFVQRKWTTGCVQCACLLRVYSPWEFQTEHNNNNNIFYIQLLYTINNHTEILPLSASILQSWNVWFWRDVGRYLKVWMNRSYRILITQHSQYTYTKIIIHSRKSYSQTRL